KTAYEITTGDWSSDVCSSDLNRTRESRRGAFATGPRRTLPSHKYLSQGPAPRGEFRLYETGGGGRWYGSHKAPSSSSIPSIGSPCHVASRSPYRSRSTTSRCFRRCTMSSV